MRIKGLEAEGIIKIENVDVWGLEESIIASGYPLSTKTVDMDSREILERDIKRVKKLGSCETGTGHDCALKGVTVQFDLKAPEYFWRQLDRYHFIDYVSSQSKMHCILKMDIDSMCNKYVSQSNICYLEKMIDAYNNFDEYRGNVKHLLLRNEEEIAFTKENLFRVIVANVPAGISLTARMTTNYLQLKSILGQRKNHKLQEWHYFCDFIKSLPSFNEFVLGE